MTYRTVAATLMGCLLAACDATSFDATGPAATQTESALAGGRKLKVGGTVHGLAGAGLVLALNGGGDLAVESNGRFRFDGWLSPGEAYEVTVKAQPTSVVQTCTVSDGTGIAGPRSIKNVVVLCSPTGRFVATGAPTTWRRGHSATLLPDGRVLLAGGFSDEWLEAMTSAELYDPSTGSFTATGDLTNRTHSHAAALLPDGKVLIAGGARFVADPVAATSAAELYDPRTGSFTPTGDMNSRRYAPTATLLPNGTVLVVGGYADDERRTNTAEIFDPSTGTFTVTGSPAADRYGHSATLLRDGTVLVAGGQGQPIALDAVRPTFGELYDPATATFTRVGDIELAWPSAALLPDGKVLIVGQLWPTVTGAFLYDPATQQFTDAGAPTCPSVSTATALRSGAVLVKGSACASIYDPETGSFSPTDAPRTNEYRTATALADGNVLITGAGSAELFEVIPPIRGR